MLRTHVYEFLCKLQTLFVYFVGAGLEWVLRTEKDDETPMSQRHRAHVVSDQEKSQFSAGFALNFFFLLRICTWYDPFHRVHNDI